jgi:hypothetical protein
VVLVFLNAAPKLRGGVCAGKGAALFFYGSRGEAAAAAMAVWLCSCARY